MKSILKKALLTVYEGIIRYNNPFYYYGIPKADYSISHGRIKLKKLNLEFNWMEGENLIRGYPFALKIQESLGGEFKFVNGNIFLRLDGLSVQINSSEELFILYEVFVSGVYRYCCIRETVFVDIGMNSGIATLFFAQNPLVKKIYAFELFKPTFLLGMQNLELNKKFTDKVEARNYGLSNKAFETIVDYSLARKGRMGLRGLPRDEHFSDVVKEHVVVKDVDKIFEEIISSSAEHDIIVKIDCEGEEFILIERLSKSGKLGDLTALMIEWHYVRPTDIENQLKAFDFHVFSQTLPSLDSGMIYAAKRKMSS